MDITQIIHNKMHIHIQAGDDGKQAGSTLYPIHTCSVIAKEVQGIAVTLGSKLLGATS